MIRHGLLVKRSCRGRLRTMKNIQHQRSMKARSVESACQVMVWTEDVISSIAHPGISNTIEYQRTKRILAEESLIQMSLPKWTFLRERLQLVQMDVKRILHSILGAAQLRNFYFGTSHRLKKCTLAYPGFDAICNHPENSVRKRTLFRRMQTFIIRTVNSKHAAVGRDALSEGLRIGIGRRESSLQLYGLFLNSKVRVTLDWTNYIILT